MDWRKSSFSASNSTCVEVAATVGGVLVRNSNHPDAGTLPFDRAAMVAFVDACRAGELDDLTV